MNRETVIALAREAGLKLFNEGWTSSDNGDAVAEENLERFAALVAEHERKGCAKLCDEIDRRWINQADKCAQAIRSRT